MLAVVNPTKEFVAKPLGYIRQHQYNRLGKYRLHLGIVTFPSDSHVTMPQPSTHTYPHLEAEGTPFKPRSFHMTSLGLFCMMPVQGVSCFVLAGLVA